MQRKKENSSQSAYKVPPHNLEAEQVILGGILINNDALNQIVDLLSSDDFYRKAHFCPGIYINKSIWTIYDVIVSNFNIFYY